MRLIVRVLQIGLPLLVLLGAGWSVYVLWSAGSFDEIESRFDGSCRQVAGVTGPEDIVIDRQAGMAYISGRDLRAARAAREGKGELRPGAIYRFDLERPWESPDNLPVNLTPDAPDSFQPHGMSLVEEGGITWLLVVNHPSEQRHEVIRYRVEEDGLVEDQRFTSPLLVSPNDIHALGRDRFYVTNDRGSGARIMHAVESFLHLPRSTIVHFDGRDWRIVADRIVFANGINGTADGQTILVGSSVERNLHLFARDRGTGDLARRARIGMPMGVDNIARDPEGVFWLAGHPRLFDFVTHAGNPEAPSPGMVVRARLAGEAAQVEEVMREDGSQLSAMSVAVPFAGSDGRQRMLVGGVFAPHFLDCRLGRNP